MEQHNPNPMVQQNLNNAPPAPQKTNTPLPLEEPKVKKRNFVLIVIVAFLFLIIPSLLTYYFLTKEEQEVEKIVNEEPEVSMEIDKEEEESVYVDSFVSKKLANLSEEFLRKESILEPSLVIHSSDSIVISPDKTRIAYSVLNEDRSGYIMVNNEKGKDYDFIGYDMIFSPDGKQFLYIAGLEEKQFVVLNNVPQERYEGMILNPTFSPDGKQLAYRVRQENEQFIVLNGEKKEAFPILSEGMQRDYDPEMTFSPDGKQFAYRGVNQEGKTLVVLNDDKKDSFPGAVNLTFSPDSKRFAYNTLGEYNSENKTTCKVVLNGEEFKTHMCNYIDNLTFSPDSKRFLYHVKVQVGKAFLVLDGIEQKHYRNIYDYDGELTFSPDSKNFVYIASLPPEDSASFYVFNEIEKFVYPYPRDFKFSPDSESLAYVYPIGVVLNDEIYHTNIRERDETYNLVFSPNGQNLAFDIRDPWETNSYYVFLDNEIFGPYKFLYTDTLEFDSAGEILKYVVRTDNEIWLKVIDVKTKRELF